MKQSKDKTPVPNMASMVLRAILEDSRYPESLYTDTLIRIRAEQGNVTYGRAAIIKAFLIKNRGWKEGDDSMGLNEECIETSYVLGRIFAVLESIQKMRILELMQQFETDILILHVQHQHQYFRF